MGLWKLWPTPGPFVAGPVYLEDVLTDEAPGPRMGKGLSESFSQ